MKKRLRSWGLILLLSSSGLFAQESRESLPGGLSNFSDSSIQILYQKQPFRRVTSAVAEVKYPVLNRTVSTTYGGLIAGRIPGLMTFQSSGQPGSDDVSVMLRGRSPLILIDGTPQSFPSINPEQIESITALKDALATALLGMRGGNGAILITTKKGAYNSGQTVQFMAQYGIQSATQTPKYVSAADYARLYNEALTNDGFAPVYTAADIQAYENGSDPARHPNVDWQKEVLKNSAPMSRYDLGISGGGSNSRYFIDLDYLNQQGLFKEKGFNSYKTNANYARYIIRSNVEVDLTKALTTSLNIFGRIQNTNQPGAGASSIFSNFRNTPALAYPVLNSDSSLAGNLNYQNNIYGQTVLSGYNQIYERDFKVDLSLKLKLDKVLQGLWIRGLAALNAYHMETTNRSKTFAVFTESVDGAGVKNFTKYGNTGDQSNSIAVNSQNRLFYTELSAGYDKTIGQDQLNVLAMFNNDYRMLNSDLPFNYTGGGLKVTYDRARKYIFEAAAGLNGTERLPSSHRYGVFPALGLGWRISEENFMKPVKATINELKLRFSAGRSGLANVGYYDYLQYYTTGSGYGFGSTIPSSTTTLQMGTLANPNISWEKADKYNAGLDASLFAGRLQLTADYYHNRYFDLVMSRFGTDIFGTDYMQDNLGSYSYSGTEFAVKWSSKPGAFNYYVAPNLSFQRSKVLAITEPQKRYDYQYLTGQPLGQPYGYVAEGLFLTPQEIQSHAYQGTNIKPGDIKYADLNGDGKIDPDDQTVIGDTHPLTIYGLDLGASFKGLELTVLFQGASHINYSLSGYRAFQNNGRAQVYQWQFDQRFNAASAMDQGYPRVYLGNNANNNLGSSYWLTKGDYLRLKNIQLAYSLPKGLTRKASISLARVFVSGTNLLTFSKLNDYQIDPEAGTGYPVMKTVVFGINLNF